MFTQVENIKDLTTCGSLEAYCRRQFGICSQDTTALVEFGNVVLSDLYGKMDYLDKYDGKGKNEPLNLGLGNVRTLIQGITKYVTRKKNYESQIRLPLAATQLNECASDLATLLISPNDSYSAFGNPNDQKYVEAVANRMSEDSVRFDHFDTLLKAFKCALHYGVAAIAVDWDKDVINQMNIAGVAENPAMGVNYTVINPACLYYTKLPDMRNFGERGDFCAVIDAIPRTAVTDLQIHPQLMPDVLDQLLSCGEDGRINAFGGNAPRDYEYLLNFTPYTSNTETESKPDETAYFSRTIVYVRITPELVGIKGGKELPPLTKTLLKLTYIGTTLINCEVSDNGIIPIVISEISRGATAASNLVPVQTFVNFLINVKQKGDRKRIFGINFFDRNRISINDISKAKELDEASPWVPVALKEGESLATAIQHFNDAPDTQHIINDIAQMKDIMQIILPTDTAALMGNLERATEWQAKKALENSGKSTKLLARQIQTSLISPLKSLHIQTIFENEAALPVKDDQGTDVMTPIAEFAGKDIMYSITTAMTGIDKDIKAQQMDTFINRLIQMPNVSQEYDITKLFDYQSALTGHQIDFSMFKRESPIDNLPKEQRDIAYQLLQQALVAQNQQAGENQPVDFNQESI